MEEIRSIKNERSIRLKQNITKNYLFTLIYNMDLTRGIWMIYLASKGMSLTQLGILETIFHITSFTMEVPTGAVADIFGRRVSRISGRVFSLISVVLLLMSNQFWGFAVSFIFTALSYNLESGAGDALIYDSLKEIKAENDYMRINGKKEVFYHFASVISFFVGGYLATKSYPLAFYITIFIGAIAVVQSYGFIEPQIESENVEEKDTSVSPDEVKKTSGYHIFKTQLVESFSAVKANPKIASLMVVGQLIGTFCTCIFFYNQNFLKSLQYDEGQIGLILALSSIAAAAVATQVHKIEGLIKEKGILFILPWVTVISIWGIALSNYHYLFFILMMMTESVSYIALTDYINRLIPSENRATILSFASMIFSFFMIIMFPIVGILGDAFNLKFAFMVMGGIGILFVGINSILIARGNQEVS